ADRGAVGGSLRPGKEGEARHQPGDARAAVARPGSGPCAGRRDHQVPAGLRRVCRADRTEVSHGTRRHHLQTAVEDADGTLSPHPDPTPHPEQGGRSPASPWCGVALLLVAWSSGILASSLLRPLRASLAVALGFAAAG